MRGSSRRRWQRCWVCGQAPRWRWPMSTRTSRSRRAPLSDRPGWSWSWARRSATWCSGPSSAWCRGCVASSRTASCRGTSATRPASRPSATSSPGSSRRACQRSTGTRRASVDLDIHALLEAKAATLAPGQSGLLALDWSNGNRSVLVDVDLSGILIGLTLATRPEEIYRALIEATAFGTQTIIRNFVEHGVPIDELYACGGLPERNHLLMQIYADVTGMPLKVSGSSQTPALGSAMFGAVAAGAAAGGYDNIVDAAAHMASLAPVTYHAEPRRPRRLPAPARRIHAPARLLRPRPEQRHEDAQSHSRRDEWREMIATCDTVGQCGPAALASFQNPDAAGLPGRARGRGRRHWLRTSSRQRACLRGRPNPEWPRSDPRRSTRPVFLPGVAAGRSAQRACERSSDWRRGAAGSPDPY